MRSGSWTHARRSGLRRQLRRRLPARTRDLRRLDNDCDGATDFAGWIPDDGGSVAKAAAIGGYYYLDAGTWAAGGIEPSTPLVLGGLGPEETTLNTASAPALDIRENLRPSGNQIEADSNYRAVGYACPNPEGSCSDVTIAGGTLTATSGTLLLAQEIGDGPTAHNRDSTYSTVSSNDRHPMTVVR